MENALILPKRRSSNMAKESENRRIAKYIADIFEGDHTEIQRFWDAKKENHIDILISTYETDDSVSFSTIGLSDHPLMEQGNDSGLRVEFVGTCDAEQADFANGAGFANILATAAFRVINSGWFCYPLMIYPNIVKEITETTLEHILFTPPFVWEPDISTLDLETKRVLWLMIVPISESEYAFAIDNSPEGLEDKLAEAEVEIRDLERDPIF